MAALIFRLSKLYLSTNMSNYHLQAQYLEAVLMRRSYFPPQYCNTMKDQRINGLLPDPLQIFPRGTSPRTDFSAFLLVITAGTKLMNGKKKKKLDYCHILAKSGCCCIQRIQACGGMWWSLWKAVKLIGWTLFYFVGFRV